MKLIIIHEVNFKCSTEGCTEKKFWNSVNNSLTDEVWHVKCQKHYHENIIDNPFKHKHCWKCGAPHQRPAKNNTKVS